MRKKTVYAALLCVIGSICFGGCGKEADTKGPAEPAEPVQEQEVSADAEADPAEDAAQTPDTTSDEDAAAAEETAQPETDYDTIYAPILSEITDTIQKGYDYDKEYQYVSNGLIERIMYPGDDDLMKVIGYVITDINDDGIKELLIGENADYESDEIGEQSYIYSGFTCADEKPVCFLEGWARNGQHYMGNGHFFNVGSNSAWSTIFGEWHLEKGGTTISWDDFYFSEEDGENGGIAFYHNKTGEYDINKADRMDVSEEDFYKIADAYKCELISWTPLRSFAGTTDQAAAEETLSEAQLKGLEKKLNDVGYYGFLLSFYGDPRDINWHEVFYDGAGYDRGYPTHEVERAYLKATGDEEIFTDLTVLSGKVLEKYVKETTGYEYSEMRYPLDWVYLKDFDLYVFQHGDTNRTQFEVVDGYKQNGVFVITYEHPMEGRCVVAFTDEGSTLRFHSNLPEGSAFDPANGGDIDQSTLTDGMIIPDSDSRKLTEDDLKGLDKQQLRIARNEIYARHGRKFTDQKLQEHFGKLPWYAPVVDPEDFDESILSEIEKYNLELIGKLEKNK